MYTLTGWTINSCSYKILHSEKTLAAYGERSMVDIIFQICEEVEKYDMHGDIDLKEIDD